MINSLRIFFIFILFIQIAHRSIGQSIPDTTDTPQSVFTEIGGFSSSAPQTPFWLRSRQYGIVPLNGPGGLIRAAIKKQFGCLKDPKMIRLTVGFEGVANIGKISQIILPVIYARLALGKFEIYGGRRREVFGLVDTLLSSGSYAWSGNALPIPKIQFGTRGFIPLGFTKGIVSINALYAHGWFGNADSVQKSFLHQKAFYTRVNLFKHRIRLYAGVLHIAQWGGESSYLDSNSAPNGKISSSLKTYWYVLTAKQPSELMGIDYGSHDGLNRFGNHLGSIDFGAEWLGRKQSLLMYYQHPFEDKSGVAFKNMPDGLYGIRWKTSPPIRRQVHINQLTLEVLSTLDQSGSSNTNTGQYAGADDYFNNFQYIDGYTYKKRIIGTPFITRWEDTKESLHNLKGPYRKLMISGNSVQAVYFAAAGGLCKNINFFIRYSFSVNYGRPMQIGPIIGYKQNSTSLTLSIHPQKWKNCLISFQNSLDIGDWLPKTYGSYVSLTKFW